MRKRLMVLAVVGVLVGLVAAPAAADPPAVLELDPDVFVDADPCNGVHDPVDRCASYVKMGYRHLIFQFFALLDAETMERLAHEVRPRLRDINIATHTS